MQYLTILDSMRNNKTYTGTASKFGVTINGLDYIIKLPKKDDLSPFTEYIASTMFTRLGLLTHRAYIGKYKGTYVSVVQDFTQDSENSLHEFNDVGQSSVDASLSKMDSYTYEDVLNILYSYKYFTPEVLNALLYQFWFMFVCDGIFGNRDRNRTNWGFMQNPVTLLCSVAPIYDNAGCIFPSANSYMPKYKNVQTRKDMVLKSGVYMPYSVFRVYNSDKGTNVKVRYGELFRDTTVNPIFHGIVTTLRQQVSWKQFAMLFKSIVDPLDVDPWIKRFWKEAIVTRYRMFILGEPFDTCYAELESLLNGGQL